MKYIAFFFVFSVSILASSGHSMCPDIKPCEHRRLFDKKRMCSFDHDCGDGYVCCVDGCFVHKICKKVVALYESREELASNPACPPKGNCQLEFLYQHSKSKECYDDNSCRNGHYCCPDCRFSHRVCRPGEPSSRSDVPYYISNNCIVFNGKCDIIPYKLSKHLECIDNMECPENYYCCEDNCYTHRICKKGLKESQPDYSKCPKDDEKCPNTFRSRISSYFACGKNSKCAVGQVCCPSRCFQHNICKPEVEDTFIMNSCPAVSEKCHQPYSMKRARMLKCESNEDCAADQMCCYHPCPRFKICTSVYDLDKINNNIDNILSPGIYTVLKPKKES